MKNIKNYIEAKNNIQNTAFTVMLMAEIDLIDLPNFIREVAQDIEDEINRQLKEQ